MSGATWISEHHWAGSLLEYELFYVRQVNPHRLGLFRAFPDRLPSQLQHRASPVMTSKRPHPLAPLSKDEFEIASLVLRSSIPDTLLFFRAIYLCEPPRSELTNFLVAEHAGSISEDTHHPARRARVEYDVIKGDRHIYMTSIVDIDRRTMIKTTSAGSGQTYFTPYDALPVVIFWTF